MALVFLEGPAEDENVIEIDDDKVVQELAENVVHQILEGSWGVGQSEGHNAILVVAIARTKGRFPFVAVRDPHKVVAAAEINLGEHLGRPEAVDGFADQRERVAVLDGDLVESAVVDTEAEAAVALLDKQDGCTSG